MQIRGYFQRLILISNLIFMMKTHLLFLGLFLFVCLCCTKDTQTKEEINIALAELDKTISNRSKFIEQKEAKIISQKSLLNSRINDDNRLEVMSMLYNEYKNFNSDSAAYYAFEIYNLAKRTNNIKSTTLALMHIVEMMTITGAYKDAFDYLDILNEREIPTELTPYYLMINTNLNRTLLETSLYSQLKEKYKAKYDEFAQLTLEANKPESSREYVINHVIMLIANGENEKALELLTNFDRTNFDDHWHAMWAHKLSEVYDNLENNDRQKYWLIRSAIADIRAAIKEYASLGDLAQLLYEEGDTELAYRYIQMAYEDASSLQAKSRLGEVSMIAPRIANAHNQLVKRNSQIMVFIIVSASLFLIIVSTLFLQLIKKKKQVSLINYELNESNNHLSTIQQKLERKNDKLKQSNHIKDIYLNRYLEMSSNYLHRLEKYRLSLQKIAQTGNNTLLYKKIKSSEIIDEEQKHFNSQFDETFLDMHTDFVQEVNNLLKEKYKIEPKSGELLNTELRIFALIRLGITDSQTIADFLFCNISTVYTYRSKFRKRSYEPDNFEANLKTIDPT